jgi:hypothetical protein
MRCGSPLSRTFAALAVLAAAAASARSAPSPAPSLRDLVVADEIAPTIANIDLTAPFHARSAWRFHATQQPAEKGQIDDDGPGQITMCLSGGRQAPCDPALDVMPDHPRAADDPGWPPHYLQAARLIYPRGRAAPPLFLVRTGSEISGDGDQAVATQVLAYRPRTDRFERIYEHLTGHNNNQEVRFIATGPLRGDIISVEPMEKAPYGFWVTVSELTPAYAYRQVLRYRSATRYGDGNPLAVIDSEMPNIEARLGLWRPGAPLPLPAGACPKPRLVKTALWCK